MQAAVSREILVTNLRGVVIEANKVDRNALGVVLFGSRARGTNRTDSDADLLWVVNGLSSIAPIGTLHLIEQGVSSCLDKLGIWGDYEGFINVRILRGVLEGTIRSSTYEAEYLSRKCRYLDEHSVVITVDGSVSENVKQFAHSLDRDWAPPAWIVNIAERRNIRVD